MTTDLLALLAIVFLSTALIGTLGAFVRLQRKTRKFQQEEDAIKNRAHQKAQTILETAQDAAFQIASEAVVKAEENRKLVQDKIEDIASKQLREYQKMVHSATENIEGEVAKNLELKMDEAFRDANTSIEAYKKQREKEIDFQPIKVLLKDPLFDKNQQFQAIQVDLEKIVFELEALKAFRG